MRIHLIAIGGAVMHNLALALQQNGHRVSGSDDEIYNPAKERLATAGLLPSAPGWFPERITADIDQVILGMHARADNPELAKARQLRLKISSFPEFIFQHAQDKTRVVVAGSHGKTTTTAMIMHVLRLCNRDFDYLVGAQLEGFGNMVRLSDAPLMVIEGDEYLSSAIDRRSKFVHYHPHVAVITGIAWDHINVFPDFEGYCRTFESLLETMERGGHLFFYEKDELLKEIVSRHSSGIHAIPYSGIPYQLSHGKAAVLREGAGPVAMGIFGDHNFANLHAAMLSCLQLGISEAEWWEAISSFKGAARRLQTLVEGESFSAWLDFAHAPSKAKATLDAVRKLQPERRLVVCLELHTFSSLSKNFLPNYARTLDLADVACVFYSPHTLEMKKMPPVSSDEIREGFQREDLHIFTEKAAMEGFLAAQNWDQTNLLLMTSGFFGGMDIPAFVKSLK